MNLPNKLSLFRIFLVPVIIVVLIFPYGQFNLVLPLIRIENILIPAQNLIVLALFVLATFTDFLDGLIARRQGLITTLGKFLDPIADKLLVNTLFIVLACQGAVRLVPVLIMIWRDVVVDGIRMVASEKNVVIAAGLLGKLKTALQMIALIVVLLNNVPFELFQIPMASFLVWLAMLVSVLGGISYFLQVRNLIFPSV